jgi:predicted O-methyltransferase YrrM
MIVNERITTYMHSLEPANTPFLTELERYAKDTYVPIIRKEMESFLQVQIAIKQPKRILEVGTAIGYSALIMAQAMPEECTITTIENYEKRIPIARENFKRAGMESKITLLEGDAMEVLPTLEGTFDFIFMDAAKGQYIHFLPCILSLLAEDGVLISDNVLQEGDLVESRYGIVRRNRTIHGRMREYLYTLKHHPQLRTSIVPIGDGITISVKQKGNL